MGAQRRRQSGKIAARVAAALAVVALLVLHNDPWRWDLWPGTDDRGASAPAPPEPVLGWMPADMVYRVAWVAVGALVLWWVLRVVWREPR